MFFVVSKVVGFIVLPSNFASLLAGVGLCLLATRWRRFGSRLAVAGIGLILLFGFSPLGDAMLLTLSEQYPPWKEGGRDPDGIIVLGGAISPEIAAARGVPELNAAAERMTAAVDLARRFPSARLVFSGGNNSLIDDGLSEAAYARVLWASMGVAPERVTLEDRSRTTAENAARAKAVVAPKPGERWLLVTSAYHIPRAMAAFRRYGFPAEAYPVDWRTRGWRDAFIPFPSLSQGLARTDTAAHEWIGLLAYWLGGRSDGLAPPCAGNSSGANCRP
jgi:uncharacterized SAM-binding protein YcdF (DUF218 family)